MRQQSRVSRSHNKTPTDKETVRGLTDSQLRARTHTWYPWLERSRDRIGPENAYVRKDSEQIDYLDLRNLQ